MSSPAWSPTSGRAWLDNRLAARFPTLFRLIGFVRFLIWLPGAIVRAVAFLLRLAAVGALSLLIGDMLWHLVFGWH